MKILSKLFKRKEDIIITEELEHYMDYIKTMMDELHTETHYYINKNEIHIVVCTEAEELDNEWTESLDNICKEFTSVAGQLELNCDVRISLVGHKDLLLYTTVS